MMVICTSLVGRKKSLIEEGKSSRRLRLRKRSRRYRQCLSASPSLSHTVRFKKLLGSWLFQ